jgi:hypothetical protein
MDYFMRGRISGVKLPDLQIEDFIQIGGMQET